MRDDLTGNPKLRVLFYRDFQSFSGGHLKVWHYFNHVLNSDQYIPEIYFSSDSKWDHNNPWLNCQNLNLKSLPLLQPDLLFVAGLDWLAFEEFIPYWSCPIINLIQGIRHSDPQDLRYQFLKNKAVRICVSQEIANSLRETNQINGKMFVIPNGLDFSMIPQSNNHKQYDLLIAGLKNPILGRTLAEQLIGQNLSVFLLQDPLSRKEFLDHLNCARITVFLPYPEEGFYLPALEGMALNTIVICPDCIGNRSFCLPNYNCLRPEYNLEAILSAIQIALNLNYEEEQKLKNNAKQTVFQHSLSAEKQAFLSILNNIKELWID